MNKKSVLVTILVFVLSIFIVIIGMHPYSMYARMVGINDYGNNPTELYRVYLAGESLGVIESKQELEDYIDSKQQQLKDKYKVSKVYAPSDLKIMKEITYNEDISTVDEIYEKIEDIKGSSSFTIDGYKIEIKGLEKQDEDSTFKTDDITLYVIDKSLFENSVKTTITAFIDSESYDNYINDTQKELSENETGTTIDSLYIENNISITKQRIPADDNIYTNSDDLNKFLLFGTTKQQETYTVALGDTISSIADNNKLSVQEFLIANTSFKSEDDLLYPGQVVNLGLISPQFDLVEEATVVSEQVHGKNVVYKNDDTKYVGTEEVEEEGKDGLDLITTKMKLVNGEIKDTVNTSTTELIPAIDKVVVRGTKQYQAYYAGGANWEVPVGIGGWIWPTNSPYTINSPFGWRWGKFHEGVDIGASYGAPIKAINNGIVVDSSYTGINGNYIVIKHSNNYYSMYAHMASRTKQLGDVVMAGDQIGTLGMTGYATGPHLHFGLYNGHPYSGGVAINPMTTIYR